MKTSLAFLCFVDSTTYSGLRDSSVTYDDAWIECTLIGEVSYFCEYLSSSRPRALPNAGRVGLQLKIRAYHRDGVPPFPSSPRAC